MEENSVSAKVDWLSNNLSIWLMNTVAGVDGRNLGRYGPPIPEPEPILVDFVRTMLNHLSIEGVDKLYFMTCKIVKEKDRDE